MKHSIKMQNFQILKINSEENITGGIWQGENNEGGGCVQYPPCDPGPCDFPVFSFFASKN